MSDFPVMLASPNKFIDRIKFPAIVQTKMDGMRANLIREDEVKVFSRNGKLMNMFSHFEDSIPKNSVVDGEFLVFKNGKLLDRQTGNGILHKAVVGTISKEEAEMVKMTIWDIIPVDKWRDGFHDEPYYKRLLQLQKINKPELFSIVDTHHVETMDEVNELYSQKIKEGEEGLIIKNRDSPWEAKRSKHMIKMKEVLEIDLRIVEFVEGEGKYKGLLGKYICQNESGSIVVGVGTGYSDEQRKQFDKSYIGKICSVRYNAIISSKSTDVKSLFLPVFVEMRPDKDKAD